MIQSNELRIGNYVYRTNKHTKEKIIMQLTASCILDISSNGINSSFIYEPIQLTEEILLKCGFEERINSSMVKFWNKNNFTIYHEYYKHNVVDNLEWFFLSSADFDRLRIYSLHQLQNLYFALTNQELEINL